MGSILWFPIVLQMFPHSPMINQRQQLHLPCEGTGDGDLDIRFKSKTRKEYTKN